MAGWLVGLSDVLLVCLMDRVRDRFVACCVAGCLRVCVPVCLLVLLLACSVVCLFVGLPVVVLVGWSFVACAFV